MSESSAVVLTRAPRAVSFRDMSRFHAPRTGLAIGVALLACLAACAAPRASGPAWFDDPAFAAAAPHGHAHNDYLHARPLRDALAAGCRGVEADVFLEGDELLVGHDRWMLRADRSLRSLYLDPLLDRVREQGGSVHGDGLPFLLLVDVKQGRAEVVARLARDLPSYAAMLTRFHGDHVEPGAVTVVLSGDRPAGDALGDGERWFAVDGRLRDLDAGPGAARVPLVSEPWTRQFEWDGHGPFDEPERAKYESLVQTARARGRWLRFWGGPDRPETWDLWRSLGSTWIHTDRLRDYARWREALDAR